MVRRMTPSQFRSHLRQQEAKYRQAVRKFESDVRREEQRINREIQQHNQKVRQNLRRAIDQYNRDVRAYNRQVEANRSRIRHALQQLSRLTVTRRHTVLHSSAYALNDAYARLQGDPAGRRLGDEYGFLVGYAEHETANSLDVTNALLGGTAERPPAEEDLAVTAITSELTRIEPDLDSRWHGALHALDPGNPDAARHFCASTREIFTTILHTRAPDADVLAATPDCALDQNGRPTRRSRIHYCLHRKGMALDALEDFVEKDIENVIDLYDVLSAGTHGPAGKYGFAELVPIKQRVEDAILFLVRIAA